MSKPTPNSGVRFRLYRLGLQNGTPVYVGLFTSVAFSRAIDTDDVMLPDIANPLNLPTKTSVPKGYTWNVKASGTYDASLMSDVDADFETATISYYQIKIDQSGANGGGTWTGPMLIKTLNTDKSEAGGKTNVSIELDGQDRPVFAAAA